MSKFSIIIENHARYVKILLTGKRNYTETIDSISEAFTSLQSNDSKVLVIDQAEACYSVSEVFNIILEILKARSEIENADLLSGVQIAYCNESAEAVDMVNFAKTVAINRGLNFNGFTLEGEAKAWLNINES